LATTGSPDAEFNDRALPYQLQSTAKHDPRPV